MNDKIKEIIDNDMMILSIDGKEKKFQKLFSFSLDNGNSYLIYTDNKKNKKGDINAYASVYDPTGEDLNLYPVETDEEWNIIDKILESISKELNGGKNEEE